MRQTICFFNTAIAWGGGEKWHYDTSLYLHERGHKVVVFTHPNSFLLKKLKKKSIPFEAIKLSNLSFVNPIKHKSLKSLFQKYDFTTIVMNLSRDVKIAGPVAKKAGLKRIIYRRGSAIPIKNTLLNRFYFKNVLTEILANSEETKRTILQNNVNLFPSAKIKVIHNGIDIPDYSLVHDQKKHDPKNGLTLINLGRLEHQKNQKFLLKVAKELLNRNIKFTLLIGGEGRLRTKLESQIKSLNLENCVFLEGYIENPLDFIKKGNVFLLPSLWEGFGYVIAEASICGLPVVTFDLSSNPELVIHGKTGYLTPKNDILKFVDAIQIFYSDKEKMEQMGMKGHHYIKENFNRKQKLNEIETYLLHG